MIREGWKERGIYYLPLFEATTLERAICKFIATKTGMDSNPSEVLLKAVVPENLCKVCIGCGDHSLSIRLQKSYAEGQNQTILRACRATIATCGMFPPITPRDYYYRDLANPVPNVYQEARNLWPDEDHEHVIVSIGTGSPPKTTYKGNVDLASDLQDMAHDSNEIAKAFLLRHAVSRLSRAGLYYRFNVSESGNVGVEEWRQSSQVRALATDYINNIAVDGSIKRCVRRLTAADSAAYFEQDMAEISNLTEAVESCDMQVVEHFLMRNLHVDAFAEHAWLRDLRSRGYSFNDLAEVLICQQMDAPWIYYSPAILQSPSASKEDYHVPSCPHIIMSRLVVSQSSITTEARAGPRYLNESTVEQVEKLCGLGGVIPSTEGKHLLNGTVTFTDGDSRSKVLYESDLGIIHALASLGAAIGLVQRLKYCCDSFTILCRHEDSVEFRTIHFASITRLWTIMQPKGPGLRMDSLTPENEDFLKSMLDTISYTPEEWHTEDIESYIALAAQVFSLGFLSYIQGHIGELDLCFLDTTQKGVELCGRWASRKSIIAAELVELTCLRGLTKGPVLVFSQVDLESPRPQGSGLWMS